MQQSSKFGKRRATQEAQSGPGPRFEASLPSELRQLITSFLDFDHIVLLSLCNRASSTRTWLDTTALRIKEAYQLEFYDTIPPKLLVGLETLRTVFSSEVLGLSWDLRHLTRLQTLTLGYPPDERGPTIAHFISPFHLPASLTSLDVTLNITKAGEIWTDICQSLTKLRRLSFYSPLSWKRILPVKNLTRLVELRLPRMRVPEDANTIISTLVETIPPTIPRQTGLEIGKICPRGLFCNLGATIDDLAKYVEFGMKPTEFAFNLCSTDIPYGRLLLREYVQRGWIDRKLLEVALPAVVAGLSSTEKFEFFANELYLPFLDQVCREFGTDPSDVPLAKRHYSPIVMSRVLYLNSSPVTVSILVFSAKKFLEELFRDPGRLFFDVHAKYGPRSLDHFVVSEAMEADLARLGLQFDPDQDAKCETILRYVWPLLNRVDLELYPDVPSLALDRSFLFDKLVNNHEFFAANYKEILDTAKPKRVQVFAHCLRSICAAGLPISPNAAGYLLKANNDGVLQEELVDALADDPIVPWLTDACFVTGAHLAFKILDKRQPYDWDRSFPRNQNALHLIASRYVPDRPDTQGRSVFKMVAHYVPPDSPLIGAADEDGKLPLFYWIQACRSNADLAENFRRLTTHFHLSRSTAAVDSDGTLLNSIIGPDEFHDLFYSPFAPVSPKFE